jgi:guanylate kinase
VRKILVTTENVNQILVISGASGSGKTSTCDLLARMYPNRYSHVLFDRSRPSRPGEIGSRKMNIDDMLQKHDKGEYFNGLVIATNNVYVATRTTDINRVFENGKVAVMEFPLERVDDFEKKFNNLNITIVELVAPSERERQRRLKKDNKYTGQHIESAEWGAGRIKRYRNGELLTLYDHNLVLITETGKQKDTVKLIHNFMQIQNLNTIQLTKIEKSESTGVQRFLRSVEMVRCKYLKSDIIDNELIEIFHLK